MADNIGNFSEIVRLARELVPTSGEVCGIPRGQCGAVTFVQRSGSALNLIPTG